MEIRDKLILIFVVIKVIPLILLAAFASNQVKGLGETVKAEYSDMLGETQELVNQIGALATENSIDALDKKARESIERLSTDTARAVAAFLYQRDDDIAFLSKMATDAEIYKNFISRKKGKIQRHKKFVLNQNQDGWKKR